MTNEQKPTDDDIQLPKKSESPEEKRQKLVNEESIEFETLIHSTDNLDMLRKIAKQEVRSLIRKRLLYDEDVERKLAVHNTSIKQLTEEKTALSCEKKVLNIEKDNLQLFVRQSACPNKLRHGIEIFPKKILPSVDNALRRQAELHQKIVEKLQPTTRAKYVTQCARKFILLALQEESVQEEQFEETLERLKKLKGGFSIESLRKFSNSKVPNMLLKLYRSVDVEDGKKLWYGDGSSWRSLKGQLVDGDLEDIINLSIPSVAMLAASDESGTVFKHDDEVTYAQDIVDVGYMLKHDDVSRHYKIICWIIYMYRKDDAIKVLLKELETKYGVQVDRATRIHRFCHEYSQLFNIVSDLDKHGPGMRPTVSCEPTPEDLEAYLDHLLASAGHDMFLVAKTVCPLNKAP